MRRGEPRRGGMCGRGRRKRGEKEECTYGRETSEGEEVGRRGNREREEGMYWKGNLKGRGSEGGGRGGVEKGRRGWRHGRMDVRERERHRRRKGEREWRGRG